MLDARNEVLHVYNAEMASRLVDAIIKDYIPAFDDLLANLEESYPKELLESF